MEGYTKAYLDVGEDEIIPDSYAAIKCSTSKDLLNMQFGCAERSWFSNDAPLNTSVMNIETRDFVYSFDRNISRKQARPTGYFAENVIHPSAQSGFAVVTSTLNGIEGIFNIPDDVKEDEHVLEIWILSRIIIYGQSITKIVHDAQGRGETSDKEFGVICAGMCTKKIHTKEVFPGEFVRYSVPRLSEFHDQAWELDTGFPRRKIGLVLRPVTEVDCLTFTLRCYTMARMMVEKSNRDDLIVSHMGLAGYGQAMEHFALMCGLNLLYRLMAYGVVCIDRSRSLDPSTKLYGDNNVSKNRRKGLHILPSGRNYGGTAFMTFIQNGNNHINYEQALKNGSVAAALAQSGRGDNMDLSEILVRRLRLKGMKAVFDRGSTKRFARASS